MRVTDKAETISGDRTAETQAEISIERAHQSYLEQKRRRKALTGKEKALFELIESVDMGNFCPGIGEVLTIASVYGNDAINSSLAFLRLGFIKGQRAEKKRQREKNLKNRKGDLKNG